LCNTWLVRHLGKPSDHRRPTAYDGRLDPAALQPASGRQPYGPLAHPVVWIGPPTPEGRAQSMTEIKDFVARKASHGEPRTASAAASISRPSAPAESAPRRPWLRS
jgi:hypothetical protein